MNTEKELKEALENMINAVSMLLEMPPSDGRKEAAKGAREHALEVLRKSKIYGVGK